MCLLVDRVIVGWLGERCPDCGGLHGSRGTGACVHCGGPAQACQAFMCRRCSWHETRLALDGDHLARELASEPGHWTRLSFDVGEQLVNVDTQTVATIAHAYGDDGQQRVRMSRDPAGAAGWTRDELAICWALR